DANLRSGILIEGGDGTVIKSSVVRSDVTAIAVRAGATNTLLSGNDVQSGGRVALSIGPAVTGTTVSGNTLLQARIGILVRNSPGVRLIGNHIGGMSVFGISVRGSSPGVVGNDNVIAGRGFQPIDVRAGAPAPVLRTTDVKGWLHRSQLTALGYLRYHPLLASWLIILTLVTLCIVATRLRRRPAMPYEHTTAWDAHEETMRTLVSGLAIPSRAAEPAGQPAGNAAFANGGSLRTQLAHELAGLVRDLGNPEA
ncbi:MAG TPA: right-handed parallel beta-helix repeat-containing protein, partial [Candidatus Dormibacteraeota bacterium]|nr:right-handed parallel beta-helix repeat-containing protein [Candidatus Dormibacteraeota bacterium]